MNKITFSSQKDFIKRINVGDLIFQERGGLLHKSIVIKKTQDYVTVFTIYNRGDYIARNNNLKGEFWE